MRSRIRQRVEERGFSMKSLSLRAGLGETAVRDLVERERDPRFETLKCMADALECSVAYLIGETDRPEPEAIRGEFQDQAAEFRDLLLRLAPQDRDRVLTMIRAFVGAGEAPDNPAGDPEPKNPARRAAAGR